MTLLDLPKITDVDHKVEPTWANDSGRNSNSGKFSGTFIGWFDTLEISVGKTNQTEFTQICDAIEHPIIENVTFTDSRTGRQKTENFYGTTISGKTNNTKGIYEPFTFSLKAIEKRSDM